jgi:hypothetical protein
MFRIFIRLQVMKENRKINQVEKKVTQKIIWQKTGSQIVTPFSRDKHFGDVISKKMYRGRKNCFGDIWHFRRYGDKIKFSCSKMKNAWVFEITS